MTGELVAHGPAPYMNDPENPDNYFVTLKSSKGNETTHWGKDLGRAMSDANANPGDRLRLERTGDDQEVDVKDEHGKVTHAVRRGWNVSNLSQQAPAHEPKKDVKVETPPPTPRTLSAAVTARSPFAELDSPGANDPDPSLHPDVPGQKRRMRM